jgi:amino acid adenylation domain-containing protein
MKLDLNLRSEAQPGTIAEKPLHRAPGTRSRPSTAARPPGRTPPNQPLLPLDHGGPAWRSFTAFPESALCHGIVTRFAAMLARHADRLAVDDGTSSMTYAQLAGLAERVAAALPQRAGAGPIPVGILLDHEARVPAAMLGILAAGHCYVSLDAGYPQERLAAIAANAGLGAIVCSGRLQAQATRLAGPSAPLVCLDHLPDAPPTHRPLHAFAVREPSDVASILYTSGSTGAPKGVFQDDRGLLHDVMQYANAIHLRPDDRLTMLYSAGTGGAVRDIWGALLTGASLHPRSPRQGATVLADFLRLGRPSIYHAVPVLLRHLGAAPAKDMQFPSVRIGYLAGDRLDAADAETFFRLFPNALLYTGLGATETSTIYVHRFIAPAMKLPGPRLPVGRPIPDRIVLLQDDQGNPVPPGEPGEIVVASRYLARGYWQAPALTAERFSADPERPGWRRFRTGDIGRLRPEDGLLEHLGRADQMVKLGGHRIELTAVEASIKALPGVAAAVALVRPGAGAAPRDALIAYWQPAGALDPRKAEIAGGAMLADLRHKLPPAMVPAELLSCAALPLLPNFKIDRAEVARRDAARTAKAALNAQVTRAGAAKGSAGQVADAAAEILQRAQPPAPGQNLLALGLDSLALVAFLVALEQRFDRTIPFEVVLAARTAARIGAWIDATSHYARPQAAGIITLRQAAAAAAPPLLWPHNLHGEVFDQIYRLLPLMPPDRDWIGLRNPGGQPGAAIADSVEDHVALMLAALRAAGLSPATGAIPVGWSFAGRLAWELASQMLAAGWHVPRVIILDAPPWPTRMPDADDDRTPQREAVRDHFLRLTAHYHARPAALDVGLVRADARFINQPDDLGWRALARRVTIATVPGNHSLFKGRRLESLAAALNDLLTA